MTNNIFYKGLDNIFYIKIDGEIYEMKFDNLIIPMWSISANDYGMINMAEQNIATIRVKIASLGSGLWYKNQYGSELPIRYMYKTLEDCIKGVNPLFDHGNYGNLYFQKVVGQIKANMCDIKPKYGYWETKESLYGETIYQLYTFRWNGVEPVTERMKSPKTIETKDLLFCNDGETLYYDLVTETFVVGSEYEKTHYASREECVKDNHVIVHRF